MDHETAQPAPTPGSKRPARRKGAAIDRSRYRRIRRFVVRVLLHALWWDVILNRPLLRRLRKPAIDRWQAIACRYRDLAVELGGVLIKLGQFLSSRVDVLPPEVTRELAALQDEVPAHDLPAIIARIEQDFDRPLADLFSWFAPQPLGAASLAQVHAARLPTGEDVVVKVLRPGIEVLVETDLTAFAQATRWLGLARGIRQRVDVAWLEREFRTVTERELDLVAEGRNAERFAQDFGDEDDVIVPEIHWSFTAAHTLTMQNVGFIKVGDLDAIEAAGISRRAVAKRMYSIYMQQFFTTYFVHADPHPGNIFVKPLPHPTEGGDTRFAIGDEVPRIDDRPFALAFVDFGMVTEIPDRLRAAMREFAIGLGTRDARRVVQSYVTAGTLLPGANLERLVEAHEAILERFWGVRLADMRDVAFSEALDLAVTFRDLIFQAPVQLQADMLFAMRAVGLLAGLATSLDADFDPWEETIPFARRFAREEQAARRSQWLDELGQVAHSLVRVPAQLDRLLGQAERGALGIRSTLSDEAQRRLHTLERAVDRLAWMVAAGSLLVSGIILRVAEIGGPVAPWLLGGAAAAAVIGLLRRR